MQFLSVRMFLVSTIISFISLLCLLILAMLAGCMSSTAPHQHSRIPALQHSAWRWIGTTAVPFTPTHTLQLPTRPEEIAADIRGNGQPLVARRTAAGMVTVHEQSNPDAAVVWHNEADSWNVTRIDAGDPNDDGRIEFVLLLWKPDEHGTLRSHPFLMGWRGGHYRIIWGGSATVMPMQDCAVGDLDADGRSELVVLEGGERPSDAGTFVSVWHWHGWGFQREWQSAPGFWHSLVLYDSDGDGIEEVFATDTTFG